MFEFCENFGHFCRNEKQKKTCFNFGGTGHCYQTSPDNSKVIPHACFRIETCDKLWRLRPATYGIVLTLTSRSPITLIRIAPHTICHHWIASRTTKLRGTATPHATDTFPKTHFQKRNILWVCAVPCAVNRDSGTTPKILKFVFGIFQLKM